MIYDCIIIGGGPAGMLASLRAAKTGCKVAVIERNNILGKKLRITGKGRCNITNDCDFDTLMANIPGNPKFLFSSFRKFSNIDIIDFFNKLGLETVVERGGRVFPKSQKAGDVAGALVNALKKSKNISLYMNTRVKDILIKKSEDNKFSVEGVLVANEDSNIQKLYSDKVICATGGLSYPLTGSTGDGYIFAEKVGHSIITPRASLAALLSNDTFIKDLSGLSLRNISIKLKSENNIIYEDFGELLFTGHGVSGPVILSASAYYKRGRETVISIDLKPALSEAQLYERLQRDFGCFDRKMYCNSLDKLLPKKLIPVFVERTGIPPTKQVNQLNKEERMKIVYLLKDFIVNISDIDDVKNAIITAGGVNIKEINPKTMESKLCSGLYFAGEVIDTDGYTGGFNLTIAFSTGYTAGESASAF
ncbi:MAG: NAD(P)/FAD-dependent oxidoreductase [Ruminococcaceae bacterium]|nr:NAD(P)/FAD-dependent oxidoreductase [Oscillospiraceae bacterium]